jgi:hypothetical protein
MADRLEAVETATAPSDADRVTRHVRRYMPFYVLLALFAIFMTVLPTRPSDEADRASEITAGDTSGGVVDGVTDGTGTSVAGTSTTPSRTGATTPGRTAAAPGASAPGSKASVPAGFDPLAWTATGKTAAGFDCKKGVRQIPWSAYAAPCFPKWTGSNGGATYRGVTAKEITIVIRRFPETANSQAVEAAAVAAGFASVEEARAVNEIFRNHLNKVYELWGRKVKWVIYESEFGDSTAEAQSKGKEGACADATYIVKDLKAFAVVDASAVFAECAAERGLVVFWGGAYFPERWYDKYHPYVWHSTMDCERISQQVAEYIGKRLANKPAKWAKSSLKDKPRKFATYVPNNDQYQYCVGITESTLEKKYGVPKGTRYDYTLDISRFPDEAARGILQFAAAGATSIVMACDPISMIFLTQSAKSQNYFPEWLNIGVALNDTDNFPRTWDADEIRNSLFGMSQLGATELILGPKGEAPTLYRKVTGTKIPEGTDGGYYNLVFVFNALQAAGPTLTPQNMANAIYRLPPGGAPRFEIGYISYRDGPDGTPGATDHTGIDDSREIYWDADATGFDGKKGAYIQTYGGKRFRNGQWPKEDPPVFK